MSLFTTIRTKQRTVEHPSTVQSAAGEGYKCQDPLLVYLHPSTSVRVGHVPFTPSEGKTSSKSQQSSQNNIDWASLKKNRIYLFSIKQKGKTDQSRMEGKYLGEIRADSLTPFENPPNSDGKKKIGKLTTAEKLAELKKVQQKKLKKAKKRNRQELLKKRNQQELLKKQNIQNLTTHEAIQEAIRDQTRLLAELQKEYEELQPNDDGTVLKLSENVRLETLVFQIGKTDLEVRRLFVLQRKNDAIREQERKKKRMNQIKRDKLFMSEY